MFRFSLAGLLIFVLLAAVGCAALVKAGELWRQVIITAAVLVFLTATLAAVVWQGERRFAATGFAVFGWAYLILTFVSALGLRNDMLTDKAVASLYTAMYGSRQESRQIIAYSPDGRVVVENYDASLQLWDAAGQTFRSGQLLAKIASGPPNYEDFADIGHALWAMLIAGLGAVLARGLRSSSAGSSPPTRVS
jgi:hypothetical protein